MARAILREQLARGPQPREALLAAAEAVGVTSAVLYHARGKLGVVSVEGDRWALPVEISPEAAA